MGLKGASVGIATVQEGDSVSVIADRYRVPLDSLIAANRLRPPYVIHPQQRLVLPPPRTYTVKRGDTIYDISRMFSTTQTRIVDLNNIPKPYLIRVGQVLKMPMPGDTTAIRKDKPVAVKRLQQKTAAARTPPLSGNGAFAVPVKGRVISAYGPKDGGLHNDGINIAAPAGTPVKAAQSGTVAYVGNGVEGFGNLVLIRHDKGYMTAYAHLDRVSVARGDPVAKGQSFATVGQTGNVGEPQLHFEIRQGVKALNPAAFL